MTISAERPVSNGRKLFSLNRESVSGIRNSTLALIKKESINKPGQEFLVQTFFLQGVDAEKWEVQGEALSSNNSSHFKEESLRPRILTESLKQMGKQSGVSLSNHDETSHQLSHYIALVPTEKNKNKEVLFLGLVPDLKAIEQIEWKYMEKSKMLKIDFVKRLDKTTTVENREWDIVCGKGEFANLATQYREKYRERIDELKKTYTIPEKETNKEWWFSWPHYGKWVEQKDIESQIPYLREAGMDSVILDDGWLVDDKYGDWDFDSEYFPSPKDMIQKVNDAGMRFGIWMGPFLIDRKSKILKEHSDWILRDAKGMTVNTLDFQVQRYCTALNLFEPVYGLDISLNDVRQHLKGKIMNLVEMGVKDLKMDFLASPFLGIPSDKSHTTLEYQYMFWQDVRSTLNETGHTDVKLSGCTIPIVMMPLFDSFRITNDSLFPPLFNKSFYKKIIDFATNEKWYADPASKTFLKLLMAFFLPNHPDKFLNIPTLITHVNTLMYEDAARVLFQRLEFWGDVFKGSSVDGLHSEKGAAQRLFNADIIAATNGTLMRLIDEYPYLNVTFGDDFTDVEIRKKWKEAFPINASRNRSPHRYTLGDI